jgi:tRNA pseudouridine55 synthase
MHGILPIDKPDGMTSADVVRIVKRLVKPSKVGHSGTLDPAASGLILVLIGAATRSLDFLDETPKRYFMTVLLGEETDSCDREGTVLSSADASAVTLDLIQEGLKRYVGVIEQTPPHFSALKMQGTPLYKLARKGIYPEIASRRIEIFSLKLKSWNCPYLELEMACSKGTYARSVARDLGRDLQVGGRLAALRRTGSGPFDVNQAVDVPEIKERGVDFVRENLISLPQALRHIPTIELLHSEFSRLSQGVGILLANSRTEKQVSALFKAVSPSEQTLILMKPEQNGSNLTIRPVKVLNCST